MFLLALKEEADAINAAIPVPEYFKWQIKKILNFEFVPMEPLTYGNRNEAPLGWLACLPKGEEEIAKLQQHDATMDRTPESSLDYRLIKEINALEKGDKKQPTIDRETFRETLLGYSMAYKTLFTKNNPHYQACWEMSRVIAGWKKLKRTKILNGQRLFRLQWRVQEDQYYHFGQTRTKAQMKDITNSLVTSFSCESPI